MGETEKITINLGVVDLGKIDLLVQEGVYSNRTDFIRTAIRAEIKEHDAVIEQSITRFAFGIGIFHFNRADLERAVQEGKRLRISVIGMFSLANDVPPRLARAAIESVRVVGVFKAAQVVKEALSDRIQ